MADSETVGLVIELRDALAAATRVLVRAGAVRDYRREAQAAGVRDGIGLLVHAWIEKETSDERRT